MMKDTTPAFPSGMMDSESGVRIAEPLNEGLSIRDYFAAKAMQGELSAMIDPDDKCSGLPLDIADSNLARLATHWYRIADAMMEARKK